MKWRDYTILPSAPLDNIGPIVMYLVVVGGVFAMGFMSGVEAILMWQGVK